MLELLSKIGATRSRNEKEELLMSHKCLDGLETITFRDILHYTYHPLMHYGISKMPHNWQGVGTETLLTTYGEWGQLLTDLESGKLSGHHAKEVVEVFIRSLDQDNANVFKKILKKDLRAGFSAKTINKAFQAEFIPVFGAMLASKWSGTITGSVYMSLKLDGLRGVYRDGYMYSRNGHKIHGVTHITDYLKARGISHLDGELTIPGKHFQDVSGALRSHDSCPDAIYNVFDTGTEDVPFNLRYEQLQHRDLGECCKVVKHVLTNDINKILTTFDKAIDAGYEGLVLKDPEHFYKKGTRSKSWMKIKNVLDEDSKITGIYEGEGKYEGMAGGFTITRDNGVEVRVGSGLSDFQREDMYVNPDNYIGVTAEMQYHEETPSGSLRHPVLKRLRTDK